MIRLLLTDRVLQLSVVVYGLALGTVAATQIAPDNVDPVLIGMAVIALLWGRRRVDQRERKFWDMLAAAWSCWMLVEVVFFLDWSIPLLSASFTTDALYILFYLVFALAVDLRPHVEAEHSLKGARRRLESVAGLTAVFGVLIYFAIVVIPEPLGISLSFVSRDRGFTPLLLVRLTLDLLLLGRLVHAASGTQRRWRRLYGLLAVGMACFALKDALAVLQSEGVFSAPQLGFAYAIFLSFPGFFVIVAARYRQLSNPVISDHTVTIDDAGDDEAVRTSPLVIYVVVVPALHFLLYPLGLLEPASRAPREIYALLYLLVLGLMAWSHQRLIMKDSRRAARALRRVEERLFRSQRLESVGRLAGGIAHDFNNYLTVIRGYTELLRERLQGPEAQSEIGYIDDAARQATHLTRQLLAYGRRQVLRPEALNLNDVVVETSKLLESLLGEDVTLTLDLDSNVGLARADLGQTEQVIMNLALNGRDAMPRGGTLSIRTRRLVLSAPAAADLELQPGSYVSLTITDNGAGMTREVQSRAQEPFFTTKEPGRGTGLGLSTVHGIVAQSGGAISLESAVGEGTTVQVLLPADDGLSQREPIAALGPQPAKEQATLLVVEDEERVRDLVVRALAGSGFRVHEASDGREALNRFSEYQPIDMLVADVMMPGMDGIQLAENLVSRCPGLRVLFISGYPADTLRERQAVLPRSIQLLEKPFTPAALVAKVNEVLAERPKSSVPVHDLVTEQGPACQ